MKIRYLFLLIGLFGCESWIYYEHTIINESDYDLPIMFKSSTYSFSDSTLIKSKNKKKYYTFDSMGKPSKQYFNEYKWHFTNGAREVDTLYIIDTTFTLTKDYRDSTNWIPDVSETLFTMTINNKFFIANADIN